MSETVGTVRDGSHVTEPLARFHQSCGSIEPIPATGSTVDQLVAVRFAGKP